MKPGSPRLRVIYFGGLLEGTFARHIRPESITLYALRFTNVSGKASQIVNHFSWQNEPCRKSTKLFLDKHDERQSLQTCTTTVKHIMHTFAKPPLIYHRSEALSIMFLGTREICPSIGESMQGNCQSGGHVLYCSQPPVMLLLDLVGLHLVLALIVGSIGYL